MKKLDQIRTESEELIELSTKTLKSYRRKAYKDRSKKFDDRDAIYKKKEERGEERSYFALKGDEKKNVDNIHRKLINRATGTRRASKRLSSDFYHKEEADVAEVTGVNTPKGEKDFIKKHKGKRVENEYSDPKYDDMFKGKVKRADNHGDNGGEASVKIVDEENLDEISKDLANRFIQKNLHSDTPEFGKRRKKWKQTPKSKKRWDSMILAGKKVAGMARVNATEDTQIDELSKGLLQRYVEKAVKQHGARYKGVDQAFGKMYKNDPKVKMRSKTRTKVAATNENAEPIDELSKGLLGRYASKAMSKAVQHADQAAYADHDGELKAQRRHWNKSVKRENGANQAISKLSGTAKVNAKEDVNEKFRHEKDLAVDFGKKHVDHPARKGVKYQTKGGFMQKAIKHIFGKGK